jgi:hypothetical protein
LWQRPKFTRFITKDCHMWIEYLDSSTQHLLKYMDRICDFTDLMLEGPRLQNQTTDSNEIPPETSGSVLIHCEQGISPLGNSCYSLSDAQAAQGFPSVLAEVRTKRPQVKPSANFIASLRFGTRFSIRYGRMKQRRYQKKNMQNFLRNEQHSLKPKD